MHQYDHGGDVYGAERPALDFSISLNPMGPPPGVLEATRAAVLDWNRYPDPKCRELPLKVGTTLPARKTRSAWVPFRPAPLGACAGRKLGLTRSQFCA